ncbi:hypothetical protein V3C99_008248 [Haemonchus contortus]|uniref:Nitroreductase domain-containing protein n=1 Tax=Haemonchus contortus TaxID=6289 RepID=A0A7I4YLH9_HAECO|nr:Nitroreductase domain containing protein [Haemonchus contortus]
MFPFLFQHSNHSEPLRIIDPKMINDLMKKLPMFLDSQSSEALLNLTVSIFVIAFIAYQAMTLTVRSSKNEGREGAVVAEVVQRNLQRDKACGEDSCFADLHDYLFTEKEILYHMPYMHEREMLRASQYFYEQMRLRRSVRSFSTRAVPLKIVQNIIKTAGCSPSVANAQPWKFCVVVSDERKADIRALVEADARENYVRRMGEGTEWVMRVSQLQETWKRPYLTDAPVLLVVCHEIFKTMGNTQVRFMQYNQISTSIAVGMMLSSIQYVGLSTVVTSPLNAGAQISRLLRRPPNECVLLLLPLGYAAADALVPDLKRKPVEQIIKLY